MRLTILAILALGHFVSIAQEPAKELNPVTVSASLQPLPVSKTGRNIVSVPGERFQQLPVHSVDELLRYVPGVEVQMRGPQGSQSDIVLRGGTFQQVLVILDGVRLNDPNTGHFNSYIPISPSEIERIEILKGASSAIYGADAVGGVINIITKSFAAKNNTSKNEASASIVAGEYSLVNSSLAGYLQKNRTTLAAGVMSKSSDGQPQRGTRGFFNNLSASASVKHFIRNNLSIAFRSAYDSRDFGAQNFYTTFASDTAEEKVTSVWNQARVSLHTGKHHLNLDMGLKFVKDIYAYNPSSIANNNRSQLLQFTFTDHYKISADGILTSGLQYQQRGIKSNDRGKHSLPQAAAFVVYHQSLNAFSFSPSLRLDYSERRGTELIPQLNLSYHTKRFQFRASAGKTIREADFTERFNNYNKALVTGGSVGNPDLVAERSFSYEAGVDYFGGENLRVSLTAFERRQRDLVDWVTTPYSEMPRKDNLSPAGTFALARNIAEVNTAGLEMDVQHHKSFGKGRQLLSTLGLLWMDSNTGDGQPSFYISSHAKFLGNLNLTYSDNRFNAGLTGIFKHRNSMEAPGINAKINRDYFVVNAMGGVWIGKKKMNIFVEVDNILDVAYSDLLGSVMPGRWVMGGVRVKW